MNEKLTIKEIVNNAIDEMQKAQDTIRTLYESLGEPIGGNESVTDDEMLIEDMSNSVEIDFALLEDDIAKLKKLKNKLKKPEISMKYDMITNQNAGKGDTFDSIFESTTLTKEYYNVAMALIENTIAYLNSVKEVEQKDNELAKKIQEG